MSEAERDATRRHAFEALQDQFHEVMAENRLLRDYAEHKPDCPAYQTMGDPGELVCICGLDQLLGDG